MPHYSKQAFEDGYDFSSLSLEEQEMTKDLYVSTRVMSDLYYVITKYESIRNNLTSNLRRLNNEWLFQDNGYYYGFIIGANRHPRNNDEFIFNLLVDNRCVKNIKFRKNCNDVIWVTIRELCDDTFVLPDLIGSLVRVNIFNGTKTDGYPFSYIKSIDFFSQEEIDTLYKMIDIMLEQTEIEEVE